LATSAVPRRCPYSPRHKPVAITIKIAVLEFATIKLTRWFVKGLLNCRKSRSVFSRLGSFPGRCGRKQLWLASLTRKIVMTGQYAIKSIVVIDIIYIIVIATAAPSLPGC